MVGFVNEPDEDIGKVRYILFDRKQPHLVGDSAVFAKGWRIKLTPETAADVFEASFGEVDSEFRRVPRESAAACYDVFSPPENFPLAGEPGRTGDTREPMIRRVRSECAYVTSLERVPKPTER